MSTGRRYHVYRNKYQRDVLWTEELETECSTLELARETVREMKANYRFMRIVDSTTGKEVK